MVECSHLTTTKNMLLHLHWLWMQEPLITAASIQKTRPYTKFANCKKKFWKLACCHFEAWKMSLAFVFVFLVISNFGVVVWSCSSKHWESGVFCNSNSIHCFQRNSQKIVSNVFMKQKHDFVCSFHSLKCKVSFFIQRESMFSEACMSYSCVHFLEC